MVLSQRVYVYGINPDGTEEFLVTELDMRAAKGYCEKHAKIFKHRFVSYQYGLPSQDRSDWNNLILLD